MELFRPEEKSSNDNVVEYDFELKKIMEYKDNREFDKYVYFLREHEEKNPVEVNILLADYFLFERITQMENAEGVQAAQKLMKSQVKEGWFFNGMSLLLGKGQFRDVGKGRKYIHTYLEMLESVENKTDRDRNYELLARLHLAKELFAWKKSKVKDLLESMENYEYARSRDVDCYTEINELTKKIYLARKAAKKRVVKTIVASIILVLILAAVIYFVIYRGIDPLEYFSYFIPQQ